ncbi:MAG: glycoside hydrolase family 127 protein [Eubacterium sp.]|nr:glycoside hydrolase family 127 protein [Eubacterium sp.]
MDSKKYSTHLTMNEVKINDNFWNSIIERVRKEVIPYQYNALQDKIDGAEKSYCIENFIKAGKIAEAIKNGKNVPVYPADKWVYDDNNCDENAFHGWVFQDSDVYKWLEAVGYSLKSQPDEKLKAQADKFIDIICKAQLDNGYLDTLYIINNRDEVFTNLKDFHELYCFGHLAESAIAYYQGTGEKKLLEATYRFADLICDTFNEKGIHGYPGHEIAELALVKLYNLSGNKKYLDTASFFIEERGKKPYYYDIVLGKETVNDNYHYNQAHIQPKDQTEAVGHAVRGVYLYSAMADLVKINNDDELYNACAKIWDNIVNKKMYITGGIGATVDGEAFSFNYDLPNDLAYSETCASIGLIFFARRMSEISNDKIYSEVIERALYNCVLSSMAEDGKSFFYVNPLEVLPEASRKDSRKRHIKPIRQKWFSCACCPPNLARLISSLSEYIFNENDNTIFINQFIGSQVKTKKCDIYIESSFIEDGKIDITVSNVKESFSLKVRIPEYVKNYTVKSPAYTTVQDGYINAEIDKECEINICFEIKPRLVKCSNRVRANVGKAAICRGPIVYALEEADNGKDLQMLTINQNAQLIYNDDGSITAQGYREEPDDTLYYDYNVSRKEEMKLTFIPYYKWGNRGENEMNVYIRLDK